MAHQSTATMPESIANAVKLLWLSLIISAVVFVWISMHGFSFVHLLRFAVVSGLWAFAIILIPSRNNLARLGLLAVTAYYVLMFVLALLSGFSFVFSIAGLLSVASLAAAAYGCFLLVQEPGNDWFGPLTSVSL